MSLTDLASHVTRALEARGLQFDLFTVPGDLLTFICPHGWTATWKDDHASVYHGVPPKGWLTLYPVPLRQAVTPEELMAAFLDEFVAPAAHRLDMVRSGRLDRLPGLEAAEFTLQLAGKDYAGLAVASVGTTQARVVCYWVEAAMFRRPLVEDLLIAVLGSIDAPEGSPFRERRLDLLHVPQHAVWQDHGLEPRHAFAAQAGRFAVRLPEGWQGREVSFEGDVGWLIVPPGVTPGDPAAPLISISGADLLAPLEDTLEQAIRALADQAVYQLEHPPVDFEVRDQQGRAQLWVGRPPTRPGEAYRLWSLGLTDGASIVHLFALAEANRMLELLPALNAIGRQLKVLPRLQNVETMRQLAGYWRFLDIEDQESEALEHCLHLRADGSFGRALRSIAPRAAITDRPAAAEVTRDRSDGTWEVVDTTLSLDNADGTREIFEIESLGERSAIIGRTFWERL
jgi:hypothetical protein